MAFRPEEVSLLAERLPAFAVDTIPEVGHFLHEEAPEVVVRAVDRMRAMITYLRALFREEGGYDDAPLPPATSPVAAGDPASSCSVAKT